jgi:hypothetical protein
MLPSLLRPPRALKSGLAGVALADQLTAGARLDVDDRRLAGNGDRLLDGADPQLDVHGGYATSRNLEPVAFDGAESRQRERQVVRAGPQVDDLVLPGAVGDDGADLLDERGAGCFDGDAGEDGTGRIPDDSGQRLRVRGGRNQHQAEDGEYERA